MERLAAYLYDGLQYLLCVGLESGPALAHGGLSGFLLLLLEPVAVGSLFAGVAAVEASSVVALRLLNGLVAVFVLASCFVHKLTSFETLASGDGWNFIWVIGAGRWCVCPRC